MSETIDKLNQLRSPFKLPDLPYAPNALEACVDEATMKIHHGLHHQAYVNNLNAAIDNQDVDLISLLKNVSERGNAVRNNGGGHWNHSFFWTVMTDKEDNKNISDDLKNEITSTFGSFENFQEAFEKAGMTQFGSGWAWLIRNAKGELEICATANQDNPLMDVATVKGTPLLGVDVWEHAYYLKYQNKRAEYLKSFWKVVNWKQVEQYSNEAK